jgi:hypothetical protein
MSHNKEQLQFLCDDCDKMILCSSGSVAERIIVPGPGDNAFIFKCAKCAKDGEICFTHTQKTWIEVASTVLFNLQRIHSREFFSIGEITNFIEDKWDILLPPNSHKRNSSWVKVLSSQILSSPIFESLEEDELLYALKSSHLSSENQKKSKKKYSNKLSVSSSPDKNSYLWCHQCKQKHDYVLYCTRDCSKKYCARCVQRHYQEQVEDLDASQWICYYCQGVCSCASCRRRRAKENNTKFKSHRGKKQKSVEDEPPTTRKRKFKPELNYDTEEKEESSIIDSLQYTLEQTPRRKLLRKRPDDKKTNSIDDSNSNIKKPSLGSRRKRVTLKDLIDSQILSSGDELSFRNSEELAVLLHDGQILWSDTIFKSLSTFAKSVAHLVGAGTKGALYNGWRVVYCRGKVMDSYRKKYERTRGNYKKNDEIDESDDSDSVEEDFNDDEPESSQLLEDVPKDDDTDQSDHFSRKSKIHKSNPEEQQINTNTEKNNNTETWWQSDWEDYNPYSTSMFELYDGYSTLNPEDPEEEQDLLIMGNSDMYLDIGDKDFFNIAEECGSAIITEGSLNNTVNNHSILIYSRNQSVDDFYSGFDCDY